MRKYFFAGFIALLPLVLTCIIVIWLVELVTTPLTGVIQDILMHHSQTPFFSLANHEVLVKFLSRVFALAFWVTVIFILGFFSRKFFLRSFLHLTDRLFYRLPFVKKIYKISHELTKVVFSGKEKTFKQTVLVPFPHKDAFVLGFVTSEALPEIFTKLVSSIEVAVFVPTAPHPMSGFILLTPKSLSCPIDVSIEDAFKFLISCGVVYPMQKNP
ncbi:MAG: DUF502 domain-containing protein [Candidatus Rhabdochlamydia sp.]|jgi:uncharacterized membrane protein|nr:hypothetical protein [Chlamydiota bacterium]